MINGTGGQKDSFDPRDIQWNELAKGASTFDWEKGFDVGVPFVVKDQNGSSSCGGMAFSYYGEALEYKYNGVYEQNSAKFIYNHTAYPNAQGSTGRDNCNFVIKSGWGAERLTPSIPATEEFMIQKDITEEAYNEAKNNIALKYANTGKSIDDIAQAISINYGAVILVAGSNNGTWLSEYPVPPKAGETVWRHWVYAGKAKKINGKKHIGILNSWGEGCGSKGWQWLSEDYFNTFVPQQADMAVLSGWTLVLKNLEIKKTQLSIIETATKAIELLTKLIGMKK